MFRPLTNAAVAVRVKIEMAIAVSFGLSFTHVAMAINPNNCEKEAVEN